jgi:internalin A
MPSGATLLTGDCSYAREAWRVYLAEVPRKYHENISEDGSASFAGQGWTEFPGWLRGLTELTELDVSGNSILQVPDWLGNLTNLTLLDLGKNRISELPESVTTLVNLTDLFLNGNRIGHLPDSIGNLSSLINLDLRGNELTQLPDSVCGLTDLTRLDLRGNRLARLPYSLDRLTELTDLYLGDNELTELPRPLAALITDNFRLDLAGNPLREPLPELVNRGQQALAVYLRSLDDASPLFEAKLLLVGEGKVGKTCLVSALKGEEFIAGRPTTHGIEISPIMFRHPRLDLDMTLRAWDFGGQEVYRVSHQFFFSQRAMYLVVWHSREGQERDEVEGWLRRIKVRVGDDAIALVVATHSRERRPDLDYPHLERMFPGMLAGSFAIDSSTSDGIGALSAAISEHAAELPQMGQRISPRWTAAREAILARARAEPQITYERFAAICERHQLAAEEISTLAKLMHDLGLIIYYDTDDGLKDVVVLNPEWLTKAISYVLEDRMTGDAGGVLNHARLKAIWQDREDGYPSQYHPYFLRLMEKFDISYRLDDDETQSLVTQLVPHQRPELPWQLDTVPSTGIRSLSLTCQMSEPAPGLVPWLTVRHHQGSTGKHWRRGVFLRHPIDAYRSEALLELVRDNELALEVRAPAPDLYFNVLRDSIEVLITRRWPGVSYRLYVPCPGKSRRPACQGRFPLDGLLKIRDAGQTDVVHCMDCGQEQQISVMLTGFTVPAEPLSVAIDQIHDQLAELTNGVEAVHGQAAEIADTVRRVSRVVSTEVTDCPRLFTLGKRRQGIIDRAMLHRDHYQLTLWCEHPGHEHPWSAATYDLDPPKAWFVKVAPYARLVFRTLQLIVPAAGAIDVDAISPPHRDDAKARLDIMQAIVDDLPSDSIAVSGREFADRDGGTGKLTQAEGQALRAARKIIFDHDYLRAFGGMRRVQSPAGDLLWVCPDHYPEYDPGLPTLP